MARITRRKLLKLSGAGAVAARSGGLAAILATQRAPAYAQETTVHWLRSADFVPASDVLLKGQITQECKKATGLKVKLETINGNDLQPRITSAIQSGAGADIIHAFNNWPQLYAESLRRRQRRRRGDRQGAGRLLRHLRSVAQVRKKWLAVPWGVARHPDCLSQVLVRGGRRHQVPRDLGQLSRRGQEAEGQGSPDRADARPHLRRRPGVLLPVSCGRGAARRSRRTARRSCSTARRPSSRSSSWQRSGRMPTTRAGLPGTTPTTTAPSSSGTICATSNAASIYIEACARPTVPDREGRAAQGRHPARALSRRGRPARQPAASAAVPHADGLFEEPEGREGLPALGAARKPVYEKWFMSQKGFSIGATRVVQARDVERGPGHAAVPRRASARRGCPAGRGRRAARRPRSVSKYIITDMYAKAVQGMTAEDAVKWAHAELVKVYA